MKCPFCGKEMDEGFVRGMAGRSIYKSFLYWNDYENKMGLFSYGLKLAADHHNVGAPAVVAYKCDDCKKIIMDTCIVEE